MIFCFWNVRGLNDPLKLKEVKRFLNHNHVHICGLFETRVKESRFDIISAKFGGNWNWATNYSFSRKGRIWIGWRTDYAQCNILSQDSQFIHCSVRDLITSELIFVTFVYGLHTVGDRKSLWPSLADIARSVQGPWVCAGDFNAIYAQDHRQGGNAPSTYEISDFANAIDDLQIYPVKSIGGNFTWSIMALLVEYIIFLEIPYGLTPIVSVWPLFCLEDFLTMLLLHLTLLICIG